MVTINQPFAIGDILFIEPICRHIWDKTGELPRLPVQDHLMFLAQHIESANIVPLSKNPFAEDDDITTKEYLPLKYANQIVRGMPRHDHSDPENMMLDKYRLAGLEPSIWKTLNIKFNEYKCNQLLDELMGESWDDYILVNEQSQAGKIDIKVESDLPIIRMHERPGYSVMDWAFVMLHAKENHHVSTSTFYILQALANNVGFAGDVFMYPRPNSDGLRGISKLEPTFKYAVRESN